MLYNLKKEVITFNKSYSIRLHQIKEEIDS